MSPFDEKKLTLDRAYPGETQNGVRAYVIRTIGDAKPMDGAQGLMLPGLLNVQSGSRLVRTTADCSRHLTPGDLLKIGAKDGSSAVYQVRFPLSPPPASHTRIFVLLFVHWGAPNVAAHAESAPPCVPLLPASASHLVPSFMPMHLPPAFKHAHYFDMLSLPVCCPLAARWCSP